MTRCRIQKLRITKGPNPRNGSLGRQAGGPIRRRFGRPRRRQERITPHECCIGRKIMIGTVIKVIGMRHLEVSSSSSTYPLDGRVVGPSVGRREGRSDGALVGRVDGRRVGSLVGNTVGTDVGDLVGPSLGGCVGNTVGSSVGSREGVTDGACGGKIQRAFVKWIDRGRLSNLSACW
jgi:hypothetical protein